MIKYVISTPSILGEGFSSYYVGRDGSGRNMWSSAGTDDAKHFDSKEDAEKICNSDLEHKHTKIERVKA